MAKKTKAAVKDAAKAALDEFVEETWTEPEEPTAEPADDLAEALRGMVSAAEAAGGRDRPEVMLARDVLTKHGKMA